MPKYQHAFSSFSADDLEKAKEFYSQTLKLEVKEQPEGLQLNIPGGGNVFIYPKPNHNPANFTVLNLLVNDIDQAVDELTENGVIFEHYDEEMLHTDDKGVCRNPDNQYPGPAAIAWFKDPAGNFISLIQEHN